MENQRRDGNSSSRAPGGGRANAQYHHYQGGSRGRHAPHHGSHHHSPAQQEWVNRPPNRVNQPSDQQAWGYRPPQMRPPQHQYQPRGRAAAWTGRPWAPTPPTPRPQFQHIPPPPPQMHAPPPADELNLSDLEISGQNPLTSLTEGKDTQRQAIRRPDRGGTISIRSISLLVNHFPVTFDSRRTILHYDVEVKPSASGDTRVVQRKMRRSDMRLIRDKLFSDDPQFKGHEIGYDGEKNIFSAVPLPTGHFTVNISEGEDVRSGSYVFTIKLVKELKLSKLNDYIRGNLLDIPRDILQGMDVVMKENPSRMRICVGRSFFPKGNSYRSNLPRGLAAYEGFQQSLKPTSQGPALCLDYSVLAFRKSLPVIEYLEQHITGFRIHEVMRLRREVERALQGVLVRVTHRPTKQKYTIAGLTKENACDAYFYDSDPENQNPRRKIFLVNYFKDKWNKDIKHKNIPCLELGKKDKSNKVPMEFCVLVEGQIYPKDRLDTNIAVVLKKLSLPKPNDRKETINEMVKAADGPCRGPVIQKFGIGVDTNMTQVVGRIIAAPRLKLRGSSVSVIQEKGQWNLLGGKHLVDGKSVERWAMVEFVDNSRRHVDNSHQFVDNLQKRCESLGMKMNQPLYYRTAQMSDLFYVDEVEIILRDVIQQCVDAKGKLQLIVCAMTEQHPGYKNLKWVSETRLGVVTQCYLSPLAARPKGQDQYFANLCLKINAKLGGSNFEIDGKLPHLDEGIPVMFIGADVNHPPPMNKTCPSIAAVVGTVNWPAANRYAARVLPQAHRCEKIMNFGSACWDLVSTYNHFNKGRPRRIVVFRDGLSEGQFEMTLNEELSDLKKTFADKGFDPKITFIVAIKRHQTRLFVENARDGGISGNVPPGTVVDKKIVHPLDFDFYLCSHYGGIGTSKPTHYYVLWDENDFTSDKLQKLIYDMCFTFARCTKSVSLVPPVFYADLAAYRGRLFQEAVMDRQSSRRSNPSASTAAPFDESSFQMHPDLKNNMFFI